MSDRIRVACLLALLLLLASLLYSASRIEILRNRLGYNEYLVTMHGLPLHYLVFESKSPSGSSGFYVLLPAETIADYMFWLAVSLAVIEGTRKARGAEVS